MELENKVAFITGGATGIGRAATELFAREGATVYLADVNESLGEAVAAEHREAGLDVTFTRLDVTDEDGVRRALDAVVSRSGRLDCAANFAAVTVQGARRPTGEVSIESFDKVVDVDLRGLFLSVKHEIQHMLEAGGSIVNCSSGSGLVGTPGNPGYVAAKHGVIGLTKAAALDYAGRGVRVNALVPGLTATPILEGIPQDVLRNVEKGIPMQRVARPDEIAQAALWLCSDRSTYATGSTLVVDGGYTAQ